MKLPVTFITRKQLVAFQEILQERDRLQAETEKASEFIQNIKQGKLDGSFDIEDQQLDSGLAAALISMQEQMRDIAQSEKERNWATEGLAKFVDILRSNNENIEMLYDNILDSLVNYIGANQGALFLALHESKRAKTAERKNEAADSDEELTEIEDDIYLELVACYAYSKKKFLHKRFDIGEGLAGQCYLEKDAIFLTDVPPSYVNITSGLGEATPRCVLIVPLKLNEKIFGVLELASFEILPKFKREFVEKLGESIASTISNAQTNERTRQLLHISQKQAADMRASEEEMRQNMEELTTTQEDMRRKEMELAGMLSAVNSTLCTAEFNMQGYVLESNRAFMDLLDYSLEEIKGKHHRIFLSKSEAASADYAHFWKELAAGHQQHGDFVRVSKYGETRWLKASYTPVPDTNGHYYKVIKLAQDITERKLAEIESKRLSLVANNTDNSVVISDADGRIEYVNSGFEKMTGYKLADVIGKKPGAFLQGELTDKSTVARIRQKITARESFYEEILNYDKNGQTYWISLSVNPIFDEEDKLVNFVAVQTNINKTKQQALDYRGKLQAIDRAYGVMEFDPEGYILDANELVLQLLGYDIVDLKGRHHRMLVKEKEARSEAYKIFWDALGNRGEYISGEYCRLTKNGEEVWFKATYSAILGLDGKPAKIVNYVQDITEAKKLAIDIQLQNEQMKAQEEELLQNMEEVKAINDEVKRQSTELRGINNALNKNLCIIELDSNGMIINANPNFLMLFGYSLEELKGKHHRTIVFPDYAKSEEYIQFWADLARGQARVGEMKRMARDGSEIWVSASYNAILDDNGRVVKIVKFAQDITQRKRMDLDTSCKLDAVQRAYCVIEFDTKGNVLTANENFLNAMGYMLHEIQGRHHSMFLTENERNDDRYLSFWERLGEKGQFVIGEFQRVTKSGEHVWLKATYSPILDLDKKPYKVVKYAQDITAAKLLEFANHQQVEEIRAQEEELRQNMEELQAINEDVERQTLELRALSQALNTTVATIEFTPEGKVLTANENFLQLMGYRLEEIQGKPHKLFVDGDYARSGEYAKFWDDLGLGKAQIGEMRRITKSGAEVWLSASYTPVTNDEGQTLKVIKFAQNITDKKKEALDVSCQLSAIDRAYAIIEFDTDGNILKANENFLEVMEYSPVEIQGRHHRMFISEAERNSEEYRAFWERLGKRGEFIEGEFKRIKKAGEVVWLKATYNPILDLKGHPYKVVKYAQDITASKQLEIQAQQQFEELQAQEEELRQNLEELEAIQESVLEKQREVESIARKYEQILEGCADAVVMIDQIGTILFFNASAESLWGYQRQEVIGQNVRMLMGTEHSIKHDSYLQNYHRTGQAKVIGKGRKVDALRKDGSSVPILLTLSEAKISDNESIFTSFIKDLRE
ncbi:PAS domain S-box-containing protein [Flexibacter flexilis DSM 6793]|uniref:Sensor protein FixL n=1 Tax=Flexibacter flexilis DSM 6793 TaxID=927664 RepID=A0A1I1DAA0_9BACT|nr:PAS domain S-box protein [Flexibacter flexilis]SFB71747.1 PAS domain S-box-containing protein [Flexibacter flexilis DSM 6793]